MEVHDMRIRPIRTLDDLTEAKKTLVSMLQENDNAKNSDDIEILSTLIEQFERAHFPVDYPTPISAIKFRMAQLDMSPRQLEPFIGSRARVSEVLSGKRALSIDMIKSLHEGLGVPYESLMSERAKQQGRADASTSTIAKLQSLGFDLDLEDIPSFISSTLQQNSAVLHRKTRTQRAASKTDQRALVIWQSAILKRSKLRRAKFDPSEFSSKDLRQIAILSSKSNGPARAIQRLAELGISVVILPCLPGTFLDGAAMLDQKGNPVIALTLRFDKVDSFWFTLLHECAHVLLHYRELQRSNSAFIDDMEIPSEDIFEREADNMARISLIPDAIISQVNWNEATLQGDLQAVASRARVHISVVAGRWQRDHRNYKRFARLIERNTVRDLLKE